MHATIYKIATEAAWRNAEKAGLFKGAAIDLSDGYMHFSSADQVRETSAKHFAGQTDMVLVAVDAKMLGDKLKYEASRGGALFPHLYAALDLAAVLWVKRLPLGPSNEHLFPELEP
jgi:uncharacterized protein (DUF952 family)